MIRTQGGDFMVVVAAHGEGNAIFSDGRIMKYLREKKRL